MRSQIAQTDAAVVVDAADGEQFAQLNLATDAVAQSSSDIKGGQIPKVGPDASADVNGIYCRRIFQSKDRYPVLA